MADTDKNRKPKKQEAAASEAATDKKGRPKKRKKRGKLILFLLLFLFIVALGVGGYFALNFNIWGIRDTVIETVNKLDPGYVTYKYMLTSVEDREKAVTDKESELRDEEARLGNIKTNLDKRESDLIVSEQNRVPIYRQPLSEEDEENLKSLGKTYASMTPAEAAKRIAALLNVEDMAAIIYNMSETSAAAVLEAMDTRLAAQITEALLRD